MIALAPGASIGRYVLESHLASGGMAEVWLASAKGPEGFEKTVVIKSILPQLAENPDFVRMFVIEARLAAALHHPNIVQIFELGEADGSYFIAMEYIPGHTLREILDRARRANKVLAPWFVCRVCSEVCEALQCAHDASDAHGRPLGLVHRDVTPENVMVTHGGDTKVLDFGVAKASREPAVGAGVLQGKLAYLAPEQISDDDSADHRADIYALGVVMYEMLTSRHPFRARTEVGLLRAIKDPDSIPRAPRDSAPWIPALLESILLKAMAKRPAARFQHADELRAALDQCLAAHGLYPTKRHVATQIEALFPETERETPSRRRPVSSQPTFRRSRQSHREPDAVVAFETGLDLIRSRDYSGARAALERALMLDPENRVYRSNLNKLRERLEDCGRG